MSKNRAARSSQSFKSSKSSSNSKRTKSKSDFKSRDKPKFKSGARPNNRSRDRGVVRSRGRPSNRSRRKPNYRSSNRSSNRYDDRNRRQSERGTTELHSTTCSECKRETKVPFKPTGVKPVYCRECYQKHKPHEGFKNLRGPSSRSAGKPNYRSSNRSSNRYDDRNRRQSERGEREFHTTTCSECKKETKVPFKPTGVKPVYCSECYQKHKPQDGFRETRSSSSRSRGKPNYRSSSRSSNRYDDRNRRQSERGEREFHTTTCSECKKETKVPFKPTGVKPVYCSECFQKHKPQDGFREARSSSSRSRGKPNYRSSSRSSSRYDDRNRTRTDGGAKQLHTVICSNCKKETQVPFKPTGAKPVYCRECFQNQKLKTESTPTSESNHVKSDEVVERFGDRTGPYRANKRMHQTTCRTCKKEIFIPFKPKARKPIYCQDCFQEVGKKK